jgi:hypothetical protein
MSRHLTIGIALLGLPVAVRADRLPTPPNTRGNCEGARASFTWRDVRGTVIDVYLPERR